MPFTNYLDQALVQHAFGAVSYTPPATVYWLLSSTLPTQPTGSSPFWNVTELSGSGYTRQSTTNNTTNFAPAGSQPTDGYEVENGTTVTFGTVTGSAWSIAAAVLVDGSGALNPGTVNVLAFVNLQVSGSNITASVGSTVSFAANALTITNN